MIRIHHSFTHKIAHAFYDSIVFILLLPFSNVTVWNVGLFLFGCCLVHELEQGIEDEFKAAKKCGLDEKQKSCQMVYIFKMSESS